MSTTITGLHADVRITSMAPPHRKGRWVHHHLPLINSGYSKFMGYEVTRSTIEGYFPRDETIRQSVASLDKATVSQVVDSFWGTANWYFTNVTFTDGPSWIRFSCNLIKA